MERQRRPELVRHERDELVLQPVELPQPLVLFRERLLRALGVGAGHSLLREQRLELRLLPLECVMSREITAVPGDDAGVVQDRRGRQRDVDLGPVLAQRARLGSSTPFPALIFRATEDSSSRRSGGTTTASFRPTISFAR